MRIQAFLAIRLKSHDFSYSEMQSETAIESGTFIVMSSSTISICGVTGFLLLTSITTWGQEKPPQASPEQQPNSKTQDNQPEQPKTPEKKARQPFVPKITIGRETTWAVSPIGPSGFIDYLGAINEQCSRGVTPENNAVVILYRATGPAPEGKPQPDAFFKKLGIAPPPADGQYYQEFTQWWKSNKGDPPAGGEQALLQMEDRCRQSPWTAAEFPEVAAWLDSIQQPLALVTEATQRPEYYSPLVSPNGEEGKLITVLLPGVQKSRALARAILSRAMRLLGENQRLQCWEDLLTLHRLGRLVGRGPTLIEGLVGVAIESMAIEAEIRFIAESKPPTKFVERYLKQLSELPARSKMADKIDNCERAMFLDCCLQIAREKMRVNDLGGNGQESSYLEKIFENYLARSINWDQILKAGNREYDDVARAMRLPTYPARTKELQKLEEHLKTLRPNPSPLAFLSVLADPTAATQFVSNALISLLLPAVTACNRAEGRIMQRSANLQVAFALSAYRSEHDAYPDSLADLAPKYLPEVPRDLFTEQPLHYKRTNEGYQLYSVGDNLKDDMGQTFGAGPDKDDLVVNIPLPK